MLQQPATDSLRAGLSNPHVCDGIPNDQYGPNCTISEDFAYVDVAAANVCTGAIEEGATERKTGPIRNQSQVLECTRRTGTARGEYPGDTPLAVRFEVRARKELCPLANSTFGGI
jgi:hypothetical protein